MAALEGKAGHAGAAMAFTSDNQQQSQQQEAGTSTDGAQQSQQISHQTAQQETASLVQSAAQPNPTEAAWFVVQAKGKVLP